MIIQALFVILKAQWNLRSLGDFPSEVGLFVIQMEVNSMTTKRIVLANSSRLVRDMLEKAIKKTPGLELVSNLENLAEFPEALSQTGADWAIVLLPPDEQVPDLVREAINDHQAMRFLLMGVDGSHARMMWNEPHEVALEEKNLKELLGLLSQDQPERIQA
jgi:DNA-binding NarL/FixJ family response regulator